MAYRLLVAAWLFAVAYAYPGYLTADSTSALVQARGAPLIDWHPPMMSILWRGCEYILSGPILMLLLQTGCFLFGIYGIARTRLAPTPAAIVATAVLLFPPVLAPMTVIWKDAQMAGFLAAGTALALSGRPGRLVPAALALFLALAMRHNAAPAVLPLVLAAARTLPILRERWWRWCGAGVTATIALVAAATLANRTITDEETHPWHQSLAVLDIAGTIRQADPMTDAQVRDLLDGLAVVPPADLQAHARGMRNHNVWWVVTHGDERLFEPPTDAATRAAVERAWRRSVLEHPVAWLHHRARMWVIVMGFPRPRHIQRVVHDYGAHAPDGSGVHAEVVLDYRRSRFQRAIGVVLDRCARTPLFAPWIYMIVAIGLIIHSRARGVVSALAASSLCHGTGLFVAVPSPDFRYAHWTIVCAVTAAALALATRWGYRRGEPSA